MRNEVWRLLKRNISVAQIAGYAVANLVGLLIIMVGLQLRGDVTGPDTTADALATDDFIVISPRVDGMGSLFTSPRYFTESDISQLSSQPWVKETGAFKSAEFSVDAGVNFGGRGMSTDLFLESVPDEFLDVNISGWDFDPDRSTVVPVILSKDYLALYNFGFAASRGLPRISEDMASMVPLTLTLSGNGRRRNIKARIAGFSSRLNTIAVPESFIDWANEVYGPGEAVEVSRLILKVDNPGNPEIEKYMRRHGYEIAGEQNGAARAAYVMNVITGVVVAIGGAISALSLVILLLSISLLLQRNRDKIASLILLGYSPAEVSRYYIKMVAWVNVIILTVATLSLLLLRGTWMPLLRDMGLEGVSIIPAAAAGCVMMAVVTVVNVIYIRRMVSSCR